MTNTMITWKYDIYGHIYIFEKVCIRNGSLMGYCKRKGKWAYLFDKYLQFEGEPPVPATLIE